MRLMKISLVLTCNPEELEKEKFDPESKSWIRIHCEKFDSCDECIGRYLKLIEKVVGPEFEVQKFNIDEIIDLKGK